jgi:arylsulfatase A-like enzyme
MDRPNFLFILIDDLGWRDLSCYGSDFYETPNLDRLASLGMSFTDAYASCPVCSPTRASILTGKYPARLGITNWIGGHERGKLISAPYVDHLPLSERTVARTLREAGYRTYHVGKWHLGAEPYWPEHHGFEANVGGCDWGAPAHGYFSPYHLPTLDDGPDGEYLTDRLTDEAIRLIESTDTDPFFMYLSYYAVHIPIQAPIDLIDKYVDKANVLGLDREPAFQVGEPFPCEHKSHLRIIRRLLQSDPAYAGMVERLDSNIGRILRALEDAGKAIDTVVFFTSDNGGLATSEGSPTCNSPLSEGKGWMYEGGTREPLIVRWPGVVAPGASCSVPVTSTDFYPTILDMAGLELLPEQHCDGASLVPVLKASGDVDREAIFWHYPHYGNQGGTPGSSIRAGDFKLIEFFEGGRTELYNLREDIGEEQDLAKDMPQLAAHLARMLADWRERLEARIPAPNPNWEGK